MQAPLGDEMGDEVGHGHLLPAARCARVRRRGEAGVTRGALLGVGPARVLGWLPWLSASAHIQFSALIWGISCALLKSGVLGGRVHEYFNFRIGLGAGLENAMKILKLLTNAIASRIKALRSKGAT